MPTNLTKKLREKAAAAQKWLCFYCHFPMSGSTSPFELPSGRRHLQQTAEHLLARRDGGGLSERNIVAAHAICNRRRHCAKQVLSPADYQQHVRRRLALRRWFDRATLQLLTEAKRT